MSFTFELLVIITRISSDTATNIMRVSKQMQELLEDFLPQQHTIVNLWEKRDKTLEQSEERQAKAELAKVISALDSGVLRVVEKTAAGWVVNEWLKMAILLYFRHHAMQMLTGAVELKDWQTGWWDKVMPKTLGWHAADFEKAGFRSVPGAFIRHGAFLGKGVVVMPAFVNIGAYVDTGTMIDSWATVGSCVQIGKNCHIASGVVLGGVLEPVQASPVIIEDDCFIGAQSAITEGVVIGQGAVLAMGVQLSQSTKIYDRKTGTITYGSIPPYSVVVPGTLPVNNDPNGAALYAAIIVKTVDAGTRAKTAINELLRD